MHTGTEQKFCRNLYETWHLLPWKLLACSFRGPLGPLGEGAKPLNATNELPSGNLT